MLLSSRYRMLLSSRLCSISSYTIYSYQTLLYSILFYYIISIMSYPYSIFNASLLYSIVSCSISSVPVLSYHILFCHNILSDPVLFYFIQFRIIYSPAHCLPYSARFLCLFPPWRAENVAIDEALYALDRALSSDTLTMTTS